MSVIYCHLNKINGKRYIGQTCRKPQERFGNNGCYYHDCPVFWRAIQKYGWDNFEHIILEENIPEDEVDDREQYWISYYHTWIDDPECNGYNADTGGSFNKKMSEETKNKMRLSKLGELNSFYGKRHSEETKEKLRQQHLGMKASEETKQKMSESKKGKFVGSKNPMFGQTGIKNVSSRAVVCIETGEIFGSQGEAAKIKGVNQSTISKNISQHTKGKKYNWRWATPEEIETLKKE